MIQQSTLPGFYPKELKAGPQRDICTPLSIAALFIIAKRQKQSKCPSTDECIFGLFSLFDIMNNAATNFVYKFLYGCMFSILLGDHSYTKIHIWWTLTPQFSGLLHFDFLFYANSGFGNNIALLEAMSFSRRMP